MKQVTRILALAIVFVVLSGGSALASGIEGGTGADEPQEPSKASFQVIKYDMEGVPYNCLDYDSEVGCLYAVEHLESGYMLYFVSPEGWRYRRFLPNYMVAYDPYGSYTARPTHYAPHPCVEY